MTVIVTRLCICVCSLAEMESACSQVSKAAGPGCVMIIWSAWQDLPAWQNVCVKYGWTKNPNMITMVRSNRSRSGKHKQQGLKSDSEHATIMHAGPDFPFHNVENKMGDKKKKKRGKKKKGSKALVGPFRDNLNALLGTWTPAYPEKEWWSNSILNYDPPTASERLRYPDGPSAGRAVRTRGEKTVCNFIPLSVFIRFSSDNELLCVVGCVFHADGRGVHRAWRPRLRPDGRHC
jgi:hypothetical protein